MSAPRLSVAICTYNPDIALLQRAIAAIAGQLGHADAELIVIDNNSSDALRPEHLGPLPADAEARSRIVRETTPGLTAARACAIAAARAPVLLFVDDDNLLDERYLERVVAAFDADPDLALLGGAIFAEFVEPPPPWLEEFQGRLVIRPYPEDVRVESTGLPHTRFWPVGAGFAVRVSDARAYQDDSDRTGRIEGRRGRELLAGEDVDLALYAISSGRKLMLDGALKLTHVIPPGRTTPEYLARCYDGGIKSTLQLERKWAPRFGQRIFLDLYRSPLSIVLRMAVCGLLGLRSPRYAIKFATYRTFARVRWDLLRDDPLAQATPRS